MLQDCRLDLCGDRQPSPFDSELTLLDDNRDLTEGDFGETGRSNSVRSTLCVTPVSPF
jgi:hypothetical protein